MSEPASESKETTSLEIVHPNAAGIDIGNAAHFVSVPPERDPQPVRRFECVTEDLKKMADLADPVRHRHGGHAIHGSVLAAGVRNTDGAWTAGISGECRPHQESAGT